MLDIPVLHEDASIVVICKPVGIVSNRARTVKEETLQDWMEERYPDVWDANGRREEDAYFFERFGLVHRLDKETSGVMVLAKTPEAFSWLLTQFRERRTHKDYIALTHGLWKTSSGSIVLPVGRQRRDRKKFGVRTDGRASTTAYTVLSRFSTWGFGDDVDTSGYQGFSLVSFTPQTGRTHQIRVHAHHIGHPVVGDYLYAGKKRAREDRKWARRTLLHATRLSFMHPNGGKRVEYSCMASDMERILQDCFGYRWIA